jgi:hypothetical protein
MWTKEHHEKIAGALRSAKVKHPDEIAPLDTLQAELARMFGEGGAPFNIGQFEADASPRASRTA